MKWNEMELNGIDWSKIELNRMEWKGMECNGIESNQIQLTEITCHWEIIYPSIAPLIMISSYSFVHNYNLSLRNCLSTFSMVLLFSSLLHMLSTISFSFLN